MMSENIHEYLKKPDIWAVGLTLAMDYGSNSVAYPPIIVTMIPHSVVFGLGGVV